MAAKLVIVRHYEPPPAEERAALLARVYDRLFDAATLERLTRRRPKCTIAPGDSGKGASYESGDIHQG